MTDAEARAILASFGIVPYKNGGRDADADGGLDCFGFFREARRALGLSVPPSHLVTDGDGQMREWELGKAEEEWVELRRPEPFCLVLLERPGRPDHCGIVLPNCLAYAHIDLQGFHFTSLDAPYNRLKQKRYFRYEGQV